MTGTDTASIARAYFDTWSNRGGPDKLRELMAEDFTFRAGDLVVEGREQFLAFGGWPEHAVTELVAQACDGPTAIQVYEATNGGVSVKIADHLTVENGRVVSSDTICDGATFQTFMAGG